MIFFTIIKFILTIIWTTLGTMTILYALDAETDGTFMAYVIKCGILTSGMITTTIALWILFMHTLFLVGGLLW